MQVLEILDRPSLRSRRMPNYSDYIVLMRYTGITRQSGSCAGKGCSLTWRGDSVCRLEVQRRQSTQGGRRRYGINVAVLYDALIQVEWNLVHRVHSI